MKRRGKRINVAKKETVRTEGLEARYERYKGILEELTVMNAF